MEEVHTPGAGTIEAVCALLKTRPKDMIKTLIYSRGDDVVVGVVRGDHDLNEAKFARLAGGHVEMAKAETIRGLCGSEVGFSGPMGMEKKVAKLVIDNWVAAMPSGVTGANRTDYHTRNVVPARDFPLSGPNVLVADIRNAAPGDTHQGKPLLFSHGVEVGHVFKLGTKYSEVLGAKFVDEAGQSRPAVMGCYGIGINRILAAAIEADAGHDTNGCILPISIAPFDVEVLPLNMDKPAVKEAAEKIYSELLAAGAEALLDDRDVRSGVKFKDSDLLGIPLRVVVGERNVKEGKVELKRRTDDKAATVLLADAAAEAMRIIQEMKKALAAGRD